MTTGDRVRFVRRRGPSGPMLDACLGKEGEVVEVYDRAGKTVLRVRFREIGWSESAVWSLKPEELEVVE